VGRGCWTSRLTVEKCPIYLCIRFLRRSGALRSRPGDPCTITWTLRDIGVSVGSLQYCVTRSGPTGLAILARPQLLRLNGAFEPGYRQLIPVDAVRPFLGGVRFWFLCDCGRRVGRLYLPSGQAAFRCRNCYNLTYRSAQEHDKRKDALLRDRSALFAAFESEDRRRVFLGLGAITQAIRRSAKRGK